MYIYFFFFLVFAFSLLFLSFCFFFPLIEYLQPPTGIIPLKTLTLNLHMYMLTKWSTSRPSYSYYLGSFYRSVLRINKITVRLRENPSSTGRSWIFIEPSLCRLFNHRCTRLLPSAYIYNIYRVSQKAWEQTYTTHCWRSNGWKKFVRSYVRRMFLLNKKKKKDTCF